MYEFAHIGFTVLIFYLVIRIFHMHRKIDFRLVVIGSVLPDLIDKPLNLLNISAGRGYAHTLVFALVLLVVTRMIKKEEFAIASMVHLLFDAMFLMPEVLFWPLYGWSMDITGYTIKSYFQVLLTDPQIYISELFGCIILGIVCKINGRCNMGGLKELILHGTMRQFKE